MTLHPALPQNLESPELLAAWIMKNAIGPAQKDEIKTYFSDEEIKEMEHESANSGREIGRLKAIEKAVKECVKKGNPTEKTITIKIPATIGVDALERNRLQNYAALESGYELETVDVYKIAYPSGRSMEYFTIEGEHLPDRSTPMSQREIREHIGVFKIDRETGNAVSEDGEILKAANE